MSAPDSPQQEGEPLIRAALMHSESDLRAQKIASNERIALKSLEVLERRNRLRYQFSFLILIFSAAFLALLVKLGAKDLALEIFKMSLAFGAGIASGMALPRPSRDTRTPPE
jgi:hypothetical protein